MPVRLVNTLRPPLNVKNSTVGRLENDDDFSVISELNILNMLNGDHSNLTCAVKTHNIFRDCVPAWKKLEMLEQGIWFFISPSYSPWALPIVLVAKKNKSISFFKIFYKNDDISEKHAFPFPQRRWKRSSKGITGQRWRVRWKNVSGRVFFAKHAKIHWRNRKHHG